MIKNRSENIVALLVGSGLERQKFENTVKKLNLEDFDQKFKDTINLIITNAPIKTIHKNKNEAEIVLMFNEIINEIKKIELRKKIEFLENKVSINLDETLYSELLLLRNQLKRG